VGPTAFDAVFEVLKHGDAVAPRRLIASGLDVNARSRFGATSLIWTRGDTACISVLLEAGADVNAEDAWGVSALAHAAQKGYVAAVTLLLDGGARVDVAPHGQPLLSYVMTGEGRNHPRIIEALRQAGAGDPPTGL
jgi:ankyrin repeat protein